MSGVERSLKWGPGMIVGTAIEAEESMSTHDKAAFVLAQIGNRAAEMWDPTLRAEAGADVMKAFGAPDSREWCISVPGPEPRVLTITPYHLRDRILLSSDKAWRMFELCADGSLKLFGGFKGGGPAEVKPGATPGDAAERNDALQALAPVAKFRGHILFHNATEVARCIERNATTDDAVVQRLLDSQSLDELKRAAVAAGIITSDEAPKAEHVPQSPNDKLIDIARRALLQAEAKLVEREHIIDQAWARSAKLADEAGALRTQLQAKRAECEELREQLAAVQRKLDAATRKR